MQGDRQTSQSFFVDVSFFRKALEIPLSKEAAKNEHEN